MAFNSSEWANKLRLIIPPNNIDEELTNFPVLVHLAADSGVTDFDATDVFHELGNNSNRKKIAVTAVSGTEESECYVEIESWSVNEFEAFLWVKVPAVYNSGDTILDFYYDETHANNISYVGDTGDTVVSGVWDDYFVGVWHMSQEPSGVAGCILDSTGNNNDGTPIGGMSSSASITGKISHALDFDIDGGSVDKANAAFLEQPGTVETVCKIQSKVDRPEVYNHGSVITYGAVYWSINFPGGSDKVSVYCYTGSLTSWESDDTVDLNTWYNITLTATASQSTFFINGLPNGSSSYTTHDNIGGSARTMHLGGQNGYPDFDGLIDEIRVSSNVRSNAWIKTTYHSNWDNLIVYSDPTATTQWLGDWSKRIKLTVDSNKIDETLANFPVLVTLASGTGRNNADVTDVFDELTVTNSGTVDSYTKLLLHMDGDQSDSQHTITVNGDSQLYATGKFDGSMYFDGSSEYVYFSDSSDWNFGSGDFTLEAWVKTSDTGSDQMVMSNWDYPSAARTWYFGTLSSQSQKMVLGVSSNGSDATDVYSDSPINDGEWHHVAGVRSGNNLYLFVDGVLQADTDTFSGAMHTEDHCEIGKYSNHTAGYFNGYMDEVRISKGVARWTSDFTPPTAPYSTTTVSGIDSYTKLMLHFDGDQSATEHTVTFNGDPQMYATQGKFDGSYYFDGSDYLTIPNNDDWYFGAGDFTVDFWINFSEMNSGTWYGISGIFGSVSANRVFSIYKYSDGIFYCTLVSDSDTVSISINQSELTIDTWHHFAIVKNNVNVMLFKDGVKVSIDTLTGSMQNSTYPLYIGRTLETGGNPYYFKGYIDEFRISNIARWTKNFNPPERAYPTYTDINSWSDKKIAITSNDGQTRLYTEIEDWNPYLQEAYLWVKAPIINKDEDTEFYLYYDSTKADNDSYVGDISSIPGKQVWDSGFDAIWHLSQDPSGGSQAMKESTSNTRHGTSAGSMTLSDSVERKIGKAVEFDGSDDVIITSDCYNFGTGNMTFEAVFKTSAEVVTNVDTILTNRDASTTDQISLFLSAATEYTYCSTYDAPSESKLDGNVALNDGEWHHLVFTRNGTSLNVYLDGDSHVSDTLTVRDVDTADNYIIGDLVVAGGVNCFNGVIEECRTSTIDRSEPWIKATYYSNWNNLLSFNSVENYAAPTTASAAAYYTHGYVRESGSPVVRTIRLYDRADGTLKDSDVSDGTGFYYLTTAVSGEHFIVAFDDELGAVYNALVLDRVVPEEIV